MWRVVPKEPNALLIQATHVQETTYKHFSTNKIIRLMFLYFIKCLGAWGGLPIIGIGRLVRWYRPTVVYTIGKYKLFLLQKVNEDERGFRFR